MPQAVMHRGIAMLCVNFERQRNVLRERFGRMTRLVTAIAVVVGSSAWAGVTLAHAFGKDIGADELVSNELQEAQKKTLDGEHFKIWLDQQAQQALVFKLINDAREQYAKDNHLEPSKAELKRCFDGLSKDADADLTGTDEGKQYGMQMSRAMMVGFKVDKALLKKFGGRIIFQQSGLEPIEAHRKLLELYEGQKKLSFSTPEIRAATYKYFEGNEPDLSSKPATASFFDKAVCEQMGAPAPAKK